MPVGDLLQNLDVFEDFFSSFIRQVFRKVTVEVVQPFVFIKSVTQVAQRLVFGTCLYLVHLMRSLDELANLRMRRLQAIEDSLK